MKLIILLPLLLLSLNCLSKLNTPETEKRDSVYYWNWDANSAKWKLSGRQINITYDDNNNILDELYQSKREDAWTDSIQYIYSYDKNNNLIFKLEKRKEKNGTLSDYSKQFYTIDTLKNRISNYKNTIKFLNSWVTEYDGTNTYDSSNLLVSQQGVDMYKNNLRWLYTYNNNKLEKGVLEIMSSNWRSHSQNLYSYDENGLLISILTQFNINNTWENNTVTKYTYHDNSIQKSKVKTRWNGVDFIKSDSSYIFYTNFKIPKAPVDLTVTQELQQGKGVMNLSWTDNADNEHGFYIERSTDINAFSKIDSSSANLNFYLDTNVTAGIIYHYRISSYNKYGISDYSNIVSSSIVISGTNSFGNSGEPLISPNPGSGKFRISFGNPESLNFEIFDAKGTLVLKEKKSDTIDISDFPKGIYFARITADNKICLKKIILK